MLTLRLVFPLALQQAEAFSCGVLRLLGLALSVPGHSTVSRRGRAFAGRQPRVQASTDPIHLVLDSTGLALFGQGEWGAGKHGRLRRQWRKLHLAVDADTGEIAAHVLTEGYADDAAQVPALLGQAEGIIASVTADGAHDGALLRGGCGTPASSTAGRRRPAPASAVPSSDEGDGGVQNRRDRHIRPVEPAQTSRKHCAFRRASRFRWGAPDMAERGRMGWQKATGHGRGNHAEMAMARCKHRIGPKPRAQSLLGQQGEAAIAVAVLNTMIPTAKPVSVRVI